jgi:hypothetical protein
MSDFLKSLIQYKIRPVELSNKISARLNDQIENLYLIE